MLRYSGASSPLNSRLDPSCFTLISWSVWIFTLSRLKLCSNQAEVYVGGKRCTEGIWSADREKIVDWIIGSSFVTEVAWRPLGLCYCGLDGVYRQVVWLWSLMASLRSLCLCERSAWQLRLSVANTEAVRPDPVLFFCIEGRLEERSIDDWLIRNWCV